MTLILGIITGKPPLSIHDALSVETLKSKGVELTALRRLKVHPSNIT